MLFEPYIIIEKYRYENYRKASAQARPEKYLSGFVHLSSRKSHPIAKFPQSIDRVKNRKI
jgi:hypothetical protein